MFSKKNIFPNEVPVDTWDAILADLLKFSSSISILLCSISENDKTFVV